MTTSSAQFEDNIRRHLTTAAENFRQLSEQTAKISEAASLLIETARRDGKVLFCGNGGSAADSQHLAAELMGRYLRDRRPLPALSLTVDTSALTAIANDYGYKDVFSRQLRGIGRAGDTLVGLSTSGNSENVLNAMRAAREMNIKTIGLTGSGGGEMAKLADICICVPSTATNFIQEMHIAIGHMLCGFVEEAVC